MATDELPDEELHDASHINIVLDIYGACADALIDASNERDMKVEDIITTIIRQTTLNEGMLEAILDDEE